MFKWWLFLLAFSARLIPIILFHNLGISLDMLQYDMLARSLAEGNGYRWYAAEDAQDLAYTLSVFGFTVTLPDDPKGIRTSFRAPFYPFMLSLVYIVTGESSRVLYARLVQAVLGAILSILTYQLALTIGLPERPGRIAGLIVALYSLLLLYPLGLVTENLFIPLLVSCVLALLCTRSSGKVEHALLAGLTIGFATLTRSLMFILWPLFTFWLYRWLKDRTKAIKLTGVLLAAMILVTLPWIIRNSLLHREPAGVETSLGYILYLGYHPTSTETAPLRTSMELLVIQDDLYRNKVGMQAALNFIASTPLRAFIHILQHSASFWGLEWREFRFFYSNNDMGELPWWLIIIIFLWLCLPLVVLLPSAIYGITSIKLGAEGQLLFGVILGLVFLHTLTIGDPRYHLTLIPFLTVFAVRGRTTRSNKRAIFITVAVSLLFFITWSLEIWREWDELAILVAPGGNRAYWGY